jgi:2,3-dihydroxybenzoate decarboxylase
MQDRPMMTDRRSLLAAAAAAVPAAGGAATLSRRRRSQVRMVATEEAFALPEWLAAMAELPMTGPDANEAKFLRFVQSVAEWRVGLVDFEQRLKVMDETGVDVHLLSLTTPGVQSFAPGPAIDMARRVNDRLVGIIAQHPTRFAGLATVAPQAPEAAAAEIERAMGALKLNGLLINSYTNDEYLDLPKYDPILAAAAKFKAPLYIHPRTPSPSMVGPFSDHGLIGALWGFAADTSLHAMRLIMSGVFDRHPDLTVVLGHMGEGIPYWFWRIDNMYDKYTRLNAGPAMGLKPLKKRPSEYFRENFYITTSGMNSHDSLKFGIDVLGADRIMFAVDYPYESSAQSAEFLNTAPISETERRKIGHLNAERVFRIR